MSAPRTPPGTRHERRGVASFDLATGKAWTSDARTTAFGAVWVLLMTMATQIVPEQAANVGSNRLVRLGTLKTARLAIFNRRWPQSVFIPSLARIDKGSWPLRGCAVCY